MLVGRINVEDFLHVSWKVLLVGIRLKSAGKGRTPICCKRNQSLQMKRGLSHSMILLVKIAMLLELQDYETEFTHLGNFNLNLRKVLWIVRVLPVLRAHYIMLTIYPMCRIVQTP
jgi:hypothetical protein